jgi:drug/metabolite transporter (DMT)-like permease
MNWHSISIPLIIIGVLLYSICQKSIPKDANALIAIASAYLVAFVSCIAVLFFNDELKKGSVLFNDQKWLTVVFLGLSLILVELGFLYAYRTGWKISTTSITTGSFTTIVLALIGVLWYKEDLSLINIIGIVLSSAGVVLINYK